MSKFVGRLARQTGRMMAAWILIGFVAGINAGLALADEVTGFAAQVIAHVLLLPTIGLMLGPFSNRYRDTVVGALLGLLIGIFFIRSDDPQSALLRGMWINIGGLVGATAWPLIRFFAATIRRVGMVPAIAAKRLLAIRPGPPASP